MSLPETITASSCHVRISAHQTWPAAARTFTRPVCLTTLPVHTGAAAAGAGCQQHALPIQPANRPSASEGQSDHLAELARNHGPRGFHRRCRDEPCRRVAARTIRQTGETSRHKRRRHTIYTTRRPSRCTTAPPPPPPPPPQPLPPPPPPPPRSHHQLITAEAGAAGHAPRRPPFPRYCDRAQPESVPMVIRGSAPGSLLDSATRLRLVPGLLPGLLRVPKAAASQPSVVSISRQSQGQRSQVAQTAEQQLSGGSGEHWTGHSTAK